MKKTVAVRFEEEELKNLDERAERANFNRSDYIRYMMAGDSIQVVDKAREIYQGLQSALTEVYKIEHSSSKTDCSKLREELLKICHILN